MKRLIEKFREIRYVGGAKHTSHPIKSRSKVNIEAVQRCWKPWISIQRYGQKLQISRSSL